MKQMDKNMMTVGFVPRISIFSLQRWMCAVISDDDDYRKEKKNVEEEGEKEEERGGGGGVDVGTYDGYDGCVFLCNTVATF